MFTPNKCYGSSWRSGNKTVTEFWGISPSAKIQQIQFKAAGFEVVGEFRCQSGCETVKNPYTVNGQWDESYTLNTEKDVCIILCCVRND